MEYKWTRMEARVIPVDSAGRKNVVKSLIVGLTALSEDGHAAYRDDMVRLPKPTDEGWVPFEEIDEAWCLAIAENAATEEEWRESMDKEIEARKSAPVVKPLSFQVVKQND